jgi:hypothetical protein
MSKLELFKKKYEINNYKRLLCTIYNADLGRSIDSDPVPNSVLCTEYVWMKTSMKIEDEQDVNIEKNP